MDFVPAQITNEECSKHLKTALLEMEIQAYSNNSTVIFCIFNALFTPLAYVSNTHDYKLAPARALPMISRLRLIDISYFIILLLPKIFSASRNIFRS